MLPSKNRDLRVRIMSEYYDVGSKAAERAQRRLASVQMAAAQEDIAREQAKARLIEQANLRQAQAMDYVGKRALAVSAAIAVGLGLAVKSAMDWESAWAGVRKTVDGSDQEMAALEGQLRRLALILPVTHEEIAGVAEAAGQLGVRRQDIAEFTRTMINLGVSTNISAQEAAVRIAQLSNVMGIGADQAGRLGATIVALGNDSATTEADILDMAQRIAGAARTVGMTTDQTLAYAAALASVGIEAEAGGTAISRVMLQIDADVASGSDRLTKYAHIAGMTATEFATAWREDAGGALAAFTEGLGQMQADGQNTTGVLAEMGFTQIRVTDALRRAALAGDLVTRSLQLGNKAWDENLALLEEANRRYQTTESRLAMARNQINDSAIDIGGVLMPVVADAADGVASLAAGFGSLPEPVQDFVVKLGLAAITVTGVGGAAAVVIPKLTRLGETINALRGGSSLLGRSLGGTAKVLKGPWGLAIAGALAVLGFWMKAQGDAKRETEEMIDTLDQQTAAITDNTRALVYQRLEEEGHVDTAKDLEIALSDLVDAAIDPASEAFAELQARSAAATEEMNAVREATPGDYAALEEVTDKYADLWAIMAVLAEMQGEVADSQDILKDRISAGVTETENATGAQSVYNLALGEGGELADTAATAIDDLARALTDLNAPALDAEAAESRFQEALDRASNSAKEHGHALDLSTDAGRANRAALRDIAEAGMAYAASIAETTGDEEAFRAALDESRQALHDSAVEMGMSEDQAWAYVDSVLAIPSEAAVKATFDAAEANEKMQTFVNRWSGYSIPVYAWMDNSQALAAIQQVQRRAGAMVMQGQGGILEFYASGALRPMDPIAQMVPANTWRVVGDRPVDDEAYIPIDGSAQSVAIWEETGRRLLGNFPAGGTDPRLLAVLTQLSGHLKSGRTGPLVVVERLESGTPQDVGDEVSWALAGRGGG